MASLAVCSVPDVPSLPPDFPSAFPSLSAPVAPILPVSRWQSALRTCLKEQPYPLFVFADATIPAASVWAGARLWTQGFRDAGLRRGDRIVLALPPSPAWLQVFVAALWDGLTLIPAPVPLHHDALTALCDMVDARAMVTLSGSGDGVFVPEGCEGPGVLPTALRPTRHAPTIDTCFLLKTSGTAGGQTGRWIALSDTNVWGVLDSHCPELAIVRGETRVLSALPYHHAFGLIIDLLPAILGGAEICRDPNNGRDTEALLDLAADMESDYFCAVPRVIKNLMQTERGRHSCKVFRAA